MAYFMCKVAYARQDDGMGIKKVSEQYLVDALSCTEAEARIIKEVQPQASFGDVDVKSIKEEIISEILLSDDADADTYYKARVAYISIDDKSGKEHRDMVTMYVKSTSLTVAVEQVNKVISSVLGESCIVSISETKVVDVYHYMTPKA